MEAQLVGPGGVATPIEPVTALLIIGLQTVVDELNKGDKAFGPNGMVVHAINTITSDLTNGLGPNNDIVRAWETMRKDILDGWGENNDIRKMLRQWGVHL